MAKDRAGNKLRTARWFDIDSQFQSFTNSVRHRDRIDLYRFRVSRASTFRAELYNLRGDATLRLLNRNGKVIQGGNERFDNGARAIRFGNRQGNPDKDPIKPIRPGIYYIQVKWKPRTGIATKYFLRAAASRFVPEADDTDSNNGFQPGKATPVDDINTTADDADSSPRWFAIVNDVLYFVADDGENGRELWRTDDGQTLELIDVNDSSGASSNPSFLTEFDGTLYFSANGGDGRGHELWRLDANGNPERVSDIFRNDLSSDPQWLTVVGDTLYFSAEDSDGRELWKLDAGSSNPVQVSNIFSDVGGNTRSSNPSWLVEFDGLLYFAATDGDGVELWRSNGTDAGTVQVENIFTSSTNSIPNSSSPDSLTVVGDRLFFAATNSDGRELWKLERDSSGNDVVSQVSDIFQGSTSSSPFYFAELNGKLYFSAIGTLRDGRELWTSDGTAAGTTLVSDIHSTTNASSNPLFLTAVGDVLLFAADNGDRGFELWQSDGTDAGTELVANINRDDSSTATDLSAFVFRSSTNTDIGELIHRMIDWDGTLFFGATEGSPEGEELWGFRPETP